MSKRNMGSSIDDFLKKEKIFEEAQAQAIKEVVAWQLAILPAWYPRRKERYEQRQTRC